MLLTNVRCPQKKGKQKKRNALDVFSFFLFTSPLLSLTDCSSPSVAKKKIKRLEEVAVWHLVKKNSKNKNKKAYSSWRRRTVTR